MKKTLLSVAAIALFATTFVACQNENKGTEGADSTNTEVADSSTTASTTDAPEATATDVPTFSSDEVNKSLAEFSTLKDEYVAALKSNNTTEIQALATKFSTWSQSAATLASKLKPEEAQKYSEYMTKISKEWSDAAMAAVQ